MNISYYFSVTGFGCFLVTLMAVAMATTEISPFICTVYYSTFLSLWVFSNSTQEHQQFR